MESLWARAVERNDRKWVILAVFLLSVSIGLLAAVAYRLDKVGAVGVAAAWRLCVCEDAHVRACLGA